MELIEDVREFILHGGGFNPDLALEIANYQLKKIPLYREYCGKLGFSRFKNLGDIVFFPAEFLKYEKIFSFRNPEGYFLSSGTTGNQSRVFYNKDSLSLYKISALRSFPFREKILSLIPRFEFSPHSSLSFMMKIFEEKMKVDYLNDSYELKPENVYPLIKDESGILFMTSTQLYKMAKWLEKKGSFVDSKFIIIDTGGYKGLNQKYDRGELQRYSSKFFPNSEFWTEYGMSELFSQFYTPYQGLYKDYPYAKVFTEGKGLLSIFDFSNFCTVSALLVPDIVEIKKEGFNVIGRTAKGIKGCGYVFR